MNIYIQQNYCVYITHYHGTLLPNNYIGSSTVKKINKGYRGSVKSKKYKELWKKELKENPQLFETHIISNHHTKQEAIYKELNLQKIFNVVKNDLFINESYAQPNGYFGRDVSGNNNPNFGNLWDEKKKENLSKLKKSKGYKERVENSNMIRYGTKYHLSSEISKRNIKQTVKEKYGVENISQIPEIKIKKVKKIKQTREQIKLNRFGYNNKEEFIIKISEIAKEKNLYNKNGKLDIGFLTKIFTNYGNGCYHALYRFCESNNILYKI